MAVAMLIHWCYVKHALSARKVKEPYVPATMTLNCSLHPQTLDCLSTQLFRTLYGDFANINVDYEAVMSDLDIDNFRGSTRHESDLQFA